jgi:hypothetical protein
VGLGDISTKPSYAFLPSPLIPMPKKELHIRITERRMNKLRLYAAQKDKTITQVVEELLDDLPEPKKLDIVEG